MKMELTKTNYDKFMSDLDEYIQKAETLIDDLHMLKKARQISFTDWVELQNQPKFEFICTSDTSRKMIGFFNIGNAEKILTLLNDGCKLQYRHGVFGNVNVWMNPERNRILVSENPTINEDNIMSYIVWCAGEWYLNTEL